jgi:hypothetical protein
MDALEKKSDRVDERSIEIEENGKGALLHPPN